MNASSPSTHTTLSLYETALHYSSNAIALCEAVRDETDSIVDFRYLLINRRYEEYANRSAQDVQGQLASALFPNALAYGIWQRAIDVMLTGTEYRQEIYFTTSANYTGWFDVTITQWGQRGVIISFVEVSDQKARLLAEHQQAELFEQVVNNSLNGIWVVESIRSKRGKLIDFKYILINQAGNLFPDMAVDQIKQTTLLTLLPNMNTVPFPGSDATKAQTIFERYIEVVETGIPITYDSDYQHDGVEGWYWVTVSKLNDGLIIKFLNISDLKRTQQKLERSNRELRQTNHNLEQFAYVSSHDLQEPLRKIQYFGDLLINRLSADVDPQVSNIIGRLQGSAQRMQVLVQDLLIYSRLTTRLEDFRMVSLSDTLAEALIDLKGLIENEGAVVECDAIQPIVPGDGAQLRQLFFCIINNALKFHQPNLAPRVKITSAVSTLDSLPPILAESGNQYVAVSVEDNGLGFDEKYTDRIFTIFQRLHGRDQYEGTGIGLALARKIAENHGGTITVRSQPGKGSMFTVWLSVDTL